jgi:hypothetical protein
MELTAQNNIVRFITKTNISDEKPKLGHDHYPYQEVFEEDPLDALTPDEMEEIRVRIAMERALREWS